MVTKRLLLFIFFSCCCLIYLTTVKGTISQIYSQQDIELLIKTILRFMKNSKTLHDLSPNFMKEIFYHFPNLTQKIQSLCSIHFSLIQFSIFVNYK